MTFARTVEQGVGPEFLLSEAPGFQSREEVTVAASQTLAAGAALGQITRGAATVTPGAVTSGSGGTPGDGLIGVVTVDAGGQAGTYKQLFTSAGATALFNILRPDGTLDGVGKTGTAYNGMLNLTQADGAADYAAGDYRSIVVEFAAGSDQVVIHDPEGTDGRENFYGFITSAVTTGVGETALAVAIVRDAEVIATRIVWDDHDADEKAAALSTAAEAGIIAR